MSSSEKPGVNEEEESQEQNWSNKQPILSSWSLPQEIFFDIFSRLPLKSVMQCKCVCKAWGFYISIPYFINLHLAKSPHGDNPNIVISTTDFVVDDNPNYAKPKVSIRRNLYIVDNVGREEEAVKPLSLPPNLSSLDIVDSVNGLLCLTDSCHNGINMYVCNPFTRENAKLPSSSSIPFKAEYNLFGFGYDCISREYKVLGLVFYSVAGSTCLADCKIEAEVCTLGSSLWRRIGEAPFSPFIVPERYVYLDGVIHWIANDIDDFSAIGIGSFNVGDEKLEFDLLLPEILPILDDYIDIGVVGGYLAVVNYSSLDFADVWVIIRSGEVECWTKLFVLALDDVVTLDLLCLLKNGEVLVLCNNEELFSCHPYNEDQVRELGIYGMSEKIHSCVHVGSLVSPLIGSGVE